MKRFLGILAVALVLAVPLATAEPIGLTVGAKVSTGDILNGALPVTVKPYADYTVGETGFYVGASWAVPVVPFSVGTLEAYEEYDLSAAGFDFALGNDNTLGLPSSFGGLLYATAAYGLPMGLTPKLEIDVIYWPYFALDSYAYLTFKADLGPGKLGAQLILYLSLYPSAILGDTTVKINYTMPVGPVNVKGELVPVLTTSNLSSLKLQLSASVTVSMDL